MWTCALQTELKKSFGGRGHPKQCRASFSASCSSFSHTAMSESEISYGKRPREVVTDDSEKDASKLATDVIWHCHKPLA